MNPPDPTGAPADARHAVAELLGRILAAYWLAHRRSECEPPTRANSAHPPLTAPSSEEYDGR